MIMKKNTTKLKMTQPVLQKESSIFMLLPALFFTSILLLIVRLYVYQRNMGQFFWYPGSNTLVDFYSHARMVSIVTIAIISALVLLGSLVIQNIHIKKSMIYIPMAVYTLFVILSYAFSDYKEFAWTGFNDRFEGTITIIAYMIMLFYIINTINSEKNVKYMLYVFAPISFFICIVGIFQYYGHNLLTVNFVKNLITPSEYKDLAPGIGASVKAATQFLYNQNYVSFYSMLPICIFSMLTIQEEKILFKLAFALLAALNLFNLWASLSSGGILGLFISFIIGIIVLGPKRLLAWKKSIGILLVFFVIATAFCLPRLLPELMQTKNYLSSSSVNTQTLPQEEPASPVSKINWIPQEALDKLTIQSDTELSIPPIAAPIETADLSTAIDSLTQWIPSAPKNNAVIAMNQVTIDEQAKEEQAKKEVLVSSYIPAQGAAQKRVIDYITTEQDHIAFSIEGKAFQINTNGTSIESITYEDGTPFGAENNMCLITTLSQANVNYVFVNIDGTRWRFALLETGPVYVSPANKGTLLQNAPSIGFKGHEEFGTYRGYIWSRTLPLLKDTLIIGHGADTFPIFFPQNDYVGRYNIGYYSQDTNIIVDKAHNMFLATGVNTGVISLLAFLAMFGFYIVQSFPLYKKSQYTSFLDYAGAGIFIGVCGFLTAGLVNDSNVGVMPLFYGLLGTGIAINMILLVKKNTALKFVED